MFDFLKALFRRESSSATAKERLRLVLLSDHLSLAPDIVDALKADLLTVISRHVEIDASLADVTFEYREREVAMLASIPILGLREDQRRRAALGNGHANGSPIALGPVREQTREAPPRDDASQPLAAPIDEADPPVAAASSGAEATSEASDAATGVQDAPAAEGRAPEAAGDVSPEDAGAPLLAGMAPAPGVNPPAADGLESREREPRTEAAAAAPGERPKRVTGNGTSRRRRRRRAAQAAKGEPPSS